ncbi:MAG: carbohydrate binding family 9 domain-containing protein [Algicola sp.]|nr:carbohydrate binding family 9 domain-containing protein [Algicola sp.]
MQWVYAFQQDTRVAFRYPITEKHTTIKVDGIVDKGEWEDYVLIDTLYNHDPSDQGLAAFRTEIKLTFDANQLYVFAKLYDDGERVIQSLQRDSDNSQWESDSFTVVIDPINKKQGGILVGVNAGGARVDGSLLVEPGRTTYSDTWDTQWKSATKQYDTHWVLEIAIPFNSLRYNNDNLEWGINFIRGHKAQNFYYTWTPFPLNFNGVDVNYMGTLVWPQVPEANNPIAFLKPYLTASAIKDNDLDLGETVSMDGGLDIKVPITKSLNADVALNPDFSNADVDQEITNITRFDISLPEQREFFLENADIFSNFGSYSIFPFFSRRIGLETPILYGARITGNLSGNLRVGVMNVQTQKDVDISAQNYTVAAFNHKVMSRSQLRGLFVNRQEIGVDSINDYARNFGGEFTFISKKGNLNTTIKYHGSVTDSKEKGSYFGINGGYSTRRFRAGWTLDVLGKDYRADVGFTPRLFNYDAEAESVVRKGYIFVNPFVTYKFFSKEEQSKLIFQGFRFYHNMFFNPDGSLNERDNNLAYDIFFKNTSRFTLMGTNNEVNLNVPTNFLGTEFDNLPVANYGFWNGIVSYSSDVRRKFTHTTSLTYGEFYNGNRFSSSLSGSIRFSYWANMGVTYDYNNISLPENYGNRNFHLLRIRAAISFTNNLFFNNVVQYNTQSQNFSVFSKLQWRYAPLSDAFLIYNQNNDTNGFDLTNRSIILKLTYRFAV